MNKDSIIQQIFWLMNFYVKKVLLGSNPGLSLVLWGSGGIGRRNGLAGYPVVKVRAALTFSAKNPLSEISREGSSPSFPTNNIKGVII